MTNFVAIYMHANDRLPRVLAVIPVDSGDVSDNKEAARLACQEHFTNQYEARLPKVLRWHWAEDDAAFLETQAGPHMYRISICDN